jgi:hypothetical protein
MNPPNAGFILAALSAGLCFLPAPSTLGADNPTPITADKSGYHLFKPTPRDLMRDMSTDRPDKTESPHTVDAGHFQIEVDLLNYTHDRHNPERASVRVDSLSIAPVNLKVGLCNRVDFQVILETYNHVRVHDRDTGTIRRYQGFGDVIPRMKINVWGNDGGLTAFAVMPYAKLPTSQDNLGNPSVEGGVILPLGVELPNEISMGLMTQFDCVRDQPGDGHHAEFVNTITFSRDLIGNLGGYVEFFSAVSAEDNSPWIGTVDFGFTYALTENIQLDAGVNIGVTRSADDWNPFLGVSWRF